MNVGFIGAGKAGAALGCYFAEHHIPVEGFFSKSPSSAQAAAEQTHTQSFPNILSLADASSLIFITTPDTAISEVWEQLLHAHEYGAVNLTGKTICHCSGCATSDIFNNIERTGAYGASAHPLLALSSPKQAQAELPSAHFTLEGDQQAINTLETLIAQLGNPIHHIEARNKKRYHAAAVFASNLVLAPLSEATVLLESCGFDQKSARDALAPLIRGNVEAFLAHGAQDALTGPVERNDLATAEAHLASMDAESAQLYRTLTKTLVALAKKKHPNRDYRAWDSVIDQRKAQA